MPKFLNFILTRTIVLYAVCCLLVWHFLDINQLMGNAIPTTLSRLTPPMDYFAEFVDKQDDFDRFKLMNCINYHEAVAHFFPYQKAEAYGMLGFCHERLGEIPQAIASYQQSIAIDPDYFWPYYDLGVIYYHQGQFTQAADYFHQALLQEPIKTYVLLSKSKVYDDVKLSQDNGSYDYLQGLKEGRDDAYILMICSLKKIGASMIADHLKPRVRFF